jgi:superfamily I DNA/RNA helicase
MQLTQQALDIVAAFKRGESLAVSAVAGGGKTTSLVAALQAAPTGTLALAFNKKTADELAAKLPPQVTSKTLNSIGNSAWKNHIGKWPKVDARKLWTLWNDYPLKKELQKDAADILRMVKIARNYGISPGNLGSKATDKDQWFRLCEDIDEPEVLFEHALRLLQKSCQVGFEGLIDFDDQIYLPTMFGSPFTKYNCIAVDEAQDLSATQHEMVRRSLATSGQLIVIGDPNQAIYSFRGALNNSFDALVDGFALKRMPLTNSFRCPRAVVREAQRYVPYIEAAGDLEGEVLRSRTSPAPALGVTVLSRFNAPLLKLASQSIRNRIAVNFLGRDFISGIATLHKKHPTPKALEEWKDGALAKAKTDSQRNQVLDRFSSLKALHEGGEVEAALAAIVAVPKENAFTLSSVHKAKGLEWDKVIYLNYDKEIEGEQEGNIKYTGVTRAKFSLTLHEGT